MRMRAARRTLTTRFARTAGEYAHAMHDMTPLLDLQALANAMNLSRIWAKDESRRRLGNFKSLGGMQAAISVLERAPPGTAVICASDGNHGLAVAAAAQDRGAPARIYLPNSVCGSRIARIAERGAQIVHVDGSYDMAVLMAKRAAMAGEGILVADTSDARDDPVVAEVVAGYGRIAEDLIRQLGGDWPTHIFVQAGVGGLAAAMAEGLLTHRGARLVVVEPKAAACVGQALSVGHPVQIPGSLESSADMLSCGLASAGAVETLKRFDCAAMAVAEADLRAAPLLLTRHGGPDTTPSGAAGLAGVIVARRDAAYRDIGLTPESRVLVLITEGLLP